jgi:hypothetical protein
MQWLNENAAGIQAITAIVIVALTSALVYVTWRYAKTLREQLAASFQPSVEMELTGPIHGYSGPTETVSETFFVRNKGDLPFKVVTVAMKLIYNKAAFPVQTVTVDAKQRVVAPEKTTEFTIQTDVPLGGNTAPYEQIVQVHCSDLAGVSKHSFSVSSREKNLTNHSIGFQPI